MANESAEHDPADCYIADCEMCKYFFRDEAADRDYRSKHGE